MSFSANSINSFVRDITRQIDFDSKTHGKCSPETTVNATRLRPVFYDSARSVGLNLHSTFLSRLCEALNFGDTIPSTSEEIQKASALYAKVSQELLTRYGSDSGRI